MRPANFPDRKNQRRKAALSRIGRRVPKPTLTEAERADYMRRLDAETIALHERIVPNASLVVTRKVGGPGVLRRPTRAPKLAPGRLSDA